MLYLKNTLLILILFVFSPPIYSQATAGVSCGGDFMRDHYIHGSVTRYSCDDPKVSACATSVTEAQAAEGTALLDSTLSNVQVDMSTGTATATGDGTRAGDLQLASEVIAAANGEAEKCAARTAAIDTIINNLNFDVPSNAASGSENCANSSAKAELETKLTEIKEGCAGGEEAGLVEEAAAFEAAVAAHEAATVNEGFAAGETAGEASAGETAGETAGDDAGNDLINGTDGSFTIGGGFEDLDGDGIPDGEVVIDSGEDLEDALGINGSSAGGGEFSGSTTDASLSDTSGSNTDIDLVIVDTEVFSEDGDVILTDADDATLDGGLFGTQSSSSRRGLVGSKFASKAKVKNAILKNKATSQLAVKKPQLPGIRGRRLASSRKNKGRKRRIRRISYQQLNEMVFFEGI